MIHLVATVLAEKTACGLSARNRAVALLGTAVSCDSCLHVAEKPTSVTVPQAVMEAGNRAAAEAIAAGAGVEAAVRAAVETTWTTAKEKK